MSLEDRKLAPILLAPEVREANRQAEARRIADVLAHGTVPDACGPDIPLAPARGALRTFRPIELVPGSLGTAQDTGHWARGEDTRRKGARIRDVFDRVELWAGDAPLAPAQVQIARDYRDLIERHEAGGMGCASLEASRGGGGGAGGEFIDAYVAEGIRIAALRRRIGTGVAMEMRRIRPSKRGAKARGNITNRKLVDMVCLGDQPLGAVLDAHGWAVKGDTREALRRALAAALDRMMGYDCAQPQNRDLTLKSG